MSEISFEGVITQGQIKLPPNVSLPDNTKVHVVISETTLKPKTRIFSPRLADPAQAKEFVMEVTEENLHA